MFETVLQVVSSLHQPIASTFTWINVILGQDYSIIIVMFVGRAFRMCEIIVVLLGAVV
jgi:hypothetical protein